MLSSCSLVSLLHAHTKGLSPISHLPRTEATPVLFTAVESPAFPINSDLLKPLKQILFNLLEIRFQCVETLQNLTLNTFSSLIPKGPRLLNTSSQKPAVDFSSRSTITLPWTPGLSIYEKSRQKIEKEERHLAVMCPPQLSFNTLRQQFSNCEWRTL